MCADLAPLANNLRDADLDECAAVSDRPVHVTIAKAMACSSRCAVVTVNGAPSFIFGRVLEGTESLQGGCVWAVGTDDIHLIWRRFLRESHGWMRWLAQGCHYTWNLVDCRNTVHIRWLQWLGFTILREIPEHGVERRPFFEFARVECVNQSPLPQLESG